ncbi:DDE Tnp4 domain-containing protein [Trichonephila inaurata madagascariensis]|uniref:DDE Tnp4 domain-containing protein n=1 Tax=Trichonephila inaurata madagascariensis TaxID=2747483 RepID=A0A8X6YY94_9ARAC|nr:DDE Tnp4 domain-containing protein [Trichonephila inaurata madagascariensis]
MGLLEPNDIVMADKGFLIENELASVGCKLQCPEFLRDKIQFDVSEMVSNCRLSNVRVTVERALLAELNSTNILKELYLTEASIM